MASTAPKRAADTTLLLFGPQTPRLAPSRLLELWSAINANPKLGFLAEIVKTLPSLWEDTILPSCPSFSNLSSVGEQLQRLVQYFDTGATESLPTEPPYEFLLVPLTVISQIAEYISLDREGTVQGFCVGFLSAAAVASSHDEAELHRWTATAVRLALCVGAIIDIDERERSSNRSSTWSIRWTSDAQEDHFRRTLASFPGVQVRVRYAFRALMHLPGIRLLQYRY